MSIYFKETLKLDPSTSGIIKTIAKQPWNWKVAYGVLFDCKPYTKRFMIFSCALILFGLVLLLLTSVHGSVFMIGLGLLIINFGGAFSDVIGDGEMVRITQKAPDGDSLNAYLQSISWTAYGVGGIFGTLLGGSVVKWFGPTGYFILLIPFPVLLVLLTLSYDQVPAYPSSLKLFGNKLVQVFQALKQPRVLKPLIFVFIQNATGIGIGEGMTYFRISIGMDAQILGFADTFAYLGLILGSVLFNKYFSKVPIDKIMIATTIISSVVSLLDLVQLRRWNVAVGISDFLFLIGYDVVGEVIGRLNLMPLMILAAKFCPDSIEATMFATIMSIFNLTSDVGSLLGSWLLSLYNINESHYEGMDRLIMLRAVLGLVPLLFIKYLKEYDYELVKDEPGIPLEPVGNIASKPTTPEGLESPRKRHVIY